MSDDDVSLDELSRNLVDARRSTEDVEIGHALAKARAKLLDRPRPITLSRYVLLDKLGSGGRGVVYKAYDPALERQVAIKLLRAGVGDEDESVGRARLVREAQAIAQLSHPNVVAVHDVGTFLRSELSGATEDARARAEDAGVFVVMEYVEGPTLGQWLTAEPRGWREIQRVFVAAGLGLAAAHEAGLIHRDFKPANVMVARDGRVRVLDFGLARLAGPRASSQEPELSSANPEPPGEELDTPLTRHGVVMGTPAYMAPEQHWGEPVDARTDQYSFCIALYEALYGTRPFASAKRVPEKRDKRQRARALAQAKRDGLPRDARPPNANVPEPLWRLLTRGLAPNPSDRFGSMRALLDELERDPHATRRRVAWGAGTLALAGALFGLSSMRAADETDTCSAHVDALQGVWDEPVRAEIQAAFTATQLPYAADTAKFVHGALDAYAQDWAGHRVAACRDAHASPDDASVQARARCLDARRASLRALADDFAHADAKMVENALDLVLALPGVEQCASTSANSAATAAQQIEIAETLAHAYALYVRDQRSRSRELAQQTLDLTRGLGDAAGEARALIALARLERSEGAPEEPLLWAAWAAAERSGDPRSIVESQVELAGAIKDQQTRLDEARGLLDVARIRLERIDEPLLRARVAGQLASIEFASGHYDAGLEEAQEAIDVIETRFGPRHPELVEFLARLASAQAESGHFEAAVGTWTRAREIAEHSLGPTHPTTLFVLAGLANLEWGRANLDGALGHARRCVETAERGYGENHLLVASCIDRLGMILGAKGDHAAAVQALRRAVEIERGRDPVEPKTLSLRLGHLAAALRAAGEPAQALAEIDAVVEIQREHFPVGHGNRTLGLEKRARILMDLGRPEDALRDYEEIVEASVGSLERVTAPNILAGMGEALVALDRAPDGIDLLERALVLTEGFEPTDTRRADVRFGLARAIADHQPLRARELARAARETYARQSTENENYRRIDAWLTGMGE